MLLKLQSNAQKRQNTLSLQKKTQWSKTQALRTIRNQKIYIATSFLAWKHMIMPF
ncbi:hypothetical protein [Spiroplasma poulsonii]|uniref:hypothetical protein n=1 Tax=Spiroplasma poulsonii TaxID=2138 RepID=UPI001F4C92D8|nr:hypothetical protein [Spiroplasma poulsonii]UNF62398.1 hypothetical protein MNU24_02735 [Spiroplasma poulsonii]